MSVSQLCRVDAELLLETSREVTRNGKAHLGTTSLIVLSVCFRNHVHILILILPNLDLPVHLLAPNVVATLVHTYHSAPVGTGHQDEQQKDYI